MVTTYQTPTIGTKKREKGTQLNYQTKTGEVKSRRELQRNWKAIKWQ